MKKIAALTGGTLMTILILGVASLPARVGLAHTHDSSANVSFSLGAASGFSVLGGTSVMNTGPTTATGNVGVIAGGSIAGFPPGIISGTLHAGDGVAATAHDDAQNAYTATATYTPTASVSGDMAGQTLTSGVYESAAALSISTTLTLDGQGDPHSFFIFQITGAFSTAAASHIILVNGAQADHIIWQASGAVTIGAQAMFTGTILGNAAITLGAGGSLVGQALSLAGAVTLSTNTISAQSAIPLGTAFNYSILAATTVTNTGNSTFSSNVGTSPGATITGFPPGITSGSLHPGDDDANHAHTDLVTAATEASDRSPTMTWPSPLNGATFAPGVYFTPGSATVTSALTLDGENNPASIFIFQIAGNLTTGSFSKIRLINSADPNNIFWEIAGTTTIGTSAVFTGTILGTGPILVHSAAQLLGRALSTSAAVTLDNDSFEILRPVSIGTASNYSLLAATAINNTGATIVNFDVGVSPGTTLNGFPPGRTTAGTFHPGDGDAATARADAAIAYADAQNRSPTASLTGDLAGQTLRAGVYSSPAALTLSGTLSLDAQNDPNAVFIIQINAAFSTAANSAILLTNGAQQSRIFWQVSGAVTLGSDSTFSGTITSAAAVTAGAQMTLTGRLISLNGAITTGSSSVSTPSPTPGTLTATTSDTTLTTVTLNGITTQYATGTSDGWSITDDRATGAPWSLSVSATDFTSEPGTTDRIPRTLPAAALTLTPGLITAAAGSDSPAGLASTTLVLSASQQTLLASADSRQGTYFLDPTFRLAIPAFAYRSNFSGVIGNSLLNPYVAVLTLTIS